METSGETRDSRYSCDRRAPPGTVKWTGGGFELGADDYVVKPQRSGTDLRVRAVLKRSNVTPTAPVEPKLMQFGVLKLDEGAHRSWIDNEEVQLTALEFKLFERFSREKVAFKVGSVYCRTSGITTPCNHAHRGHPYSSVAREAGACRRVY